MYSYYSLVDVLPTDGPFKFHIIYKLCDLISYTVLVGMQNTAQTNPI